MEQEVAVRMTNFSAILNDLTASFAGRNEYIERLCRFPLLIIDDFGMERGTEYGLEPVSYTHLGISLRDGNTGRTPPMADNRKYYYLKLKENFFDSDSIVLLDVYKRQL